MKDILRTVAAFFAGLVVITLVAEGIEFGLVTLLHGSVTTDPATYFAVRNRPGVLALKLVYNSAAAVLGGFVCAWIAGRRRLFHGLVLAVLQTTGLIYGMTGSEYAPTTPLWMWIALIFISAAGILWGAKLGQDRAERAAYS